MNTQTDETATQCTICLESTQSTESGALMQPCRCSFIWMHESCFQQWTHRSVRRCTYCHVTHRKTVPRCPYLSLTILTLVSFGIFFGMVYLLGCVLHRYRPRPESTHSTFYADEDAFNQSFFLLMHLILIALSWSEEFLFETVCEDMKNACQLPIEAETPIGVYIIAILPFCFIFYLSLPGRLVLECIDRYKSING
jgi:hypothetical protein